MELDDQAPSVVKIVAVIVRNVLTAELQSCGALAGQQRPLYESNPRGKRTMRYALLWLLGIPIPALLLLWMFGGL